MGNFKIREFRKAMGINQDEMASVIGLTQSNLSRYENNGVELTDDMINKLRERFGKEVVDPYITDSVEQVRGKEVPPGMKDDLTVLDLVSIVKKQNETICLQVEAQNEFARQLAGMNSRLLTLLEKIQFE